MLPNALIKGYDKVRLRNLLAIFFLALAIPTAILIWHAYGQLKWEAFHQYRGLAEELTSRIDTRLIDMVHSADASSFADYTFLVVTGDPSVNFLQRSPLSGYPVTGDPPGLLGYFQVDTRGAFSSPLLPPEGSDSEKFGIGGEEYKDRLLLTQEIHEILADNRLVQAGPKLGLTRAVAASPAVVRAGLEKRTQAYESSDVQSRARRPATVPEPRDGAEVTGTKTIAVEEQAAATKDTYSQQVFDQLNLPRQEMEAGSIHAGERDLDGADDEKKGRQQQVSAFGKVADLNLDSVFQKKSEEHESQSDQLQKKGNAQAPAPARSKRKEQITLAESPLPSSEEPVTNAVADHRIRTFESEVDPLDFSMLDSGHLVLFRKVWRGGERYIQGLLIDQQTFIRDTIDTPYMETALSGISHLIVARGEDVIHAVSGCDSYNCPDGNPGSDGALVFRDRLSAPLDSIELIFSINRLPPGPGAAVLGWVTLVLALVFLSGFYTLYRLGLSQINLARQQQDFVSAVSHELKTPLTSIRMYGEILKEGWADEEKKKTYYEYIHDESERLARLISNVLQLANITHNEPQFDLKPVKVGELMSNIESKIASQVERAGFNLRFQRDDKIDQATVMIDEDCFAQIIINLVDNAIKFSEHADNKTIEITGKLASDQQILFSIRDFGPGIPKDQMKKIFQLFYRPKSELTRETVGTGIGLAIVHQLTVAMGGKVDVINRSRGAEFTVTFSGIPAVE